jgi:chromosome segregation ATPase
VPGFTQLISTMDRAGELTREVKGKRTYRIAAVADAPRLRASSGAKSDAAAASSAAAKSAGAKSAAAKSNFAQSDAAESMEMDYDQVASALLVQVVQTLTKGSTGREGEGSWARRRIERLERQVNELERDLSQAKAESKSVAEERDELRLQLEHSEGNLALLTDRLSTGKVREGHVSKRLGPDERALLHQLRSSSVSGRAGRAG